MASSFTLYSIFRKYIMDGTLDLDTNTIKLALVTSDYVFDASHAVLADVLSSPSPEVVAVASPDNGYTAGGKELTGCAVTKIDSPSAGKFDANDVTWIALTATFRYGILHAVGTLNGIVNPLIGCILYDTEPADIVVAGVDWTTRWNASGIITD